MSKHAMNTTSERVDRPPADRSNPAQAKGRPRRLRRWSVAQLLAQGTARPPNRSAPKRGEPPWALDAAPAMSSTVD